MDASNNSIIVSSTDLIPLLRRHNIPDAYGQSCELVGPGSYQLKCSSTGFLSSFLGSGVGVVLCDEAAGIGGMIHFLLSEPVGRSSARHPEYYASSGLQFFIDTLVASGARKEQLKASVAGGILIGQPREAAKNLGTGELMSDVVLRMLTELQIPIVQVAVGGFTPCSMLLDTENWQVTIKLYTSRDSSSVISLPPRPTAEKIDQAISGVKPIPQVALKIMQLLGEQTSSRFENLAEEIKKDQVVASRVIRYCNSPVMRFSQNIASIDRAVVLLGENNLLEIAITTAVDFIYNDQDRGYALMQGGLYRHALAAAYAAKEIATFTGSVEPGLAYTAGLIHDIGKVVLDGFVADALPFFYQHLEQQSGDFCELENRLFDINHIQVGAQLALQWNLPSSLAVAISHHHQPATAPVGHQQLASIAYLADLLATHYLAGVELERVAAEQLNASLEAVGLRSTQLPLIIDNIPWVRLMRM